MDIALKTNPLDNFIKHLEGSQNIFFSGVYGIGKTTFLKNRFNNIDGDLKDQYISFHLFPVNYSVAKNKDIFELIKYDLLYQLLVLFEPKVLNEKSSIYTSDFLGFAVEKYDILFYNFLYSIPKIGGSLKNIRDNLNVIIEEYEKFREESNRALDQMSFFEDSFSNKKGSIYENDFITQLIITLIKKLDKDKKTVLIIDDLDRIDPDHLFRILNIFSSHFDYNSSEIEYSNKFEIDKIIFVADYQNVKNIFYHKYGKNTDYGGYIDKFYSNEIYEIGFQDNLYDILYSSINGRNYATDLLRIILSILFDNNKLNLRQFKKLNGIISQNFPINNYNQIFLILKALYGNDINELENSIKSCAIFRKEYIDSEDFTQFSELVLKTCFELKSQNINFKASENKDFFIFNLSAGEISFMKTNPIRETFIKINPNQNISIKDLWFILTDAISLNKSRPI